MAFYKKIYEIINQFNSKFYFAFLAVGMITFGLLLLAGEIRLAALSKASQ